MGQERGTEVAFNVHPRPVATGASPVHPLRLPPRFGTAPKGTAADDVSHHKDGLAGDLAFFTRYVFGGY